MQTFICSRFKLLAVGKRVALLMFASTRSDWQLVYANTAGVDLTQKLEDPFTVAIDAADRLLLKSGDTTIASTDFRSGHRAPVYVEFEHFEGSPTNNYV